MVYIVYVYEDQDEIEYIEFQIVRVYEAAVDALNFVAQFPTDPSRKNAESITAHSNFYDAAIFNPFVDVNENANQRLDEELEHGDIKLQYTMPSPLDQSDAAQKFRDEYERATREIQDPEDESDIFAQMRYKELVREEDKMAEDIIKKYEELLNGYTIGGGSRIAISKFPVIKAQRF